MSLPRADEWTDPGSLDPPRRRGRRALIAVAILAATVAVGLIAWWATSLQGLPRVEPFDVVAAGTVAIPDAENAYTLYRAAASKLAEPPKGLSRGLPSSWDDIPRAERDWFFASGDAVGLWLEGTARDRSVYNQPRDMRFDTNLDVAHRLRSLARLGLIAGLRMESQGELEEAWDWYRAVLRCSRHVEMHGEFIERLHGIRMIDAASGPVQVWSDHPNLNVGLLRKALDELVAIDGMTPPYSQNLRAEYYLTAALLDDPDLSLWKIRNGLDATAPPTQEEGPTPRDRLAEAFWRLALREPERSRRAMNLLWANWLSACDLPAAERARGRKSSPYLLYDPPEAARRLSPEALDRWVASTRLLHPLLPNAEAIERAIDGESGVRAGLILHLAERLYIREHGEPPGSPDALVGPYLKALPEGIDRPTTPNPR